MIEKTEWNVLAKSDNCRIVSISETIDAEFYRTVMKAYEKYSSYVSDSHQTPLSFESFVKEYMTALNDLIFMKVLSRNTSYGNPK